MKNKQLNRLEAINAILGLALVVSLVFNIWLFTKPNNSSISLIETVSAAELHPLFTCPCCGETIDAKCCGMAEERLKLIDSLILEKASKDEIIMAYIKEYGLDSFKDETQKEEFRERLIAAAPSERPIIIIDPVIYDFGDISQEEGMATTVFEIKNEGSENLIIDRLETSCGCTTAAVVYQGEEGPLFGMPGHGLNEEIGNWQVVISPGDTAELKVYYDPNVHQDFRGLAIREIYVFSNDAIDFSKKVRVELNQVD